MMGFLQRSGASLTFIACNIAPALDAAIASGNSRWPTLATLASRGTLDKLELDVDAPSATLRRCQLSVLKAAGLAGSEQAHPSAALSRSGEVQQITTEAWAHLQCVHFAAGLNDVTGVLLQGDAQLSEHDRDQIAVTIQDHLRDEGYELHASSDRDWLLRLPRALDARTVAPEIAFGGSLQRALPQGRDAAALRRLMTELQMLLHEHPVNVKRGRAGLPPANAIWIWGIGAITELRRKHTLPTAFGNDAYLRGLYLLYGQSVRAEPVAAEMLREKHPAGAKLLVLANVPDLDSLESEWLNPMLGAMRRGSIERLELHLDRWRIAADRSDLRRFWKRAVALSQWGT